MGLIDRAVGSLCERDARRVAIAIIVVLSALPTLLHADLARTGRGYSMAWLAALYVIGACMRRFGWLSRLRGRKGLAAYVCLGLAAFVSKTAVELASSWLLGAPEGTGWFISYDSPLMLGMAACLVAAFSDTGMLERRERIVSFWSSSAFAVYLAHGTWLAYAVVLDGAFAWVAGLHPLLLPAACLGGAAAVYVACTLIDKARAALFSFAGIDRRIDDLLDGGLRSQGTEEDAR